MRLLRLAADGFGSLRGEFRFDPGRLVLVLDENERGKSTLLAAVVAALYGLEDDRRSHRVLTPLERWRPWDGDSYRLELELERAGDRYTIRRDFGRGKVEIWDGWGKEVTEQFREGKDEYPVGPKLLGLARDEFEKCALVEHGELLRVVPSDEKERRDAALRARLETAADTRIGDQTASAALRLLEGAARRYDCAEVEFTGTVEHAIQRLEAKRALLETERKTLENDFAAIGGPLEELADLGEEERRTREALAGLETERRAGRAAELRRQLEEERQRRDELAGLRREAEALVGLADLPANAEGQFREALARHEEAQRSLEALEARRREEIARERATLEAERASLAAFESGGAEDADLCVTLAAEIRRVTEEETRLRDDIFGLRETLATEGHDHERLQWLQNRLGQLSEADHRLLRRQSELALTQQTQVSDLESQRTSSSEALREIDAARNRVGLPGWFLVALGLAGIVAGVAVVGLQGLPVLSTAFLAAGGGLLLIGGALIWVGRRLRGVDRDDALRGLSEAQRRLNQLRHERAETEVRLEGLARAMGYRDHVELLREWSELTRLLEESAPTTQAQQRLGALEERRRSAVEQARTRFGESSADLETLESIAVGLRRLESIRQRLEALDKSWSWIDDEKKVVEAEASGLKERAIRILRSAGLAYDPALTWAEHAHDLAGRLRSRARHATLVEDLIPGAQRRLRSAEEVAELENELALFADLERPPAPRGLRAIEDEILRLRERLDEVSRRRGDLRVQVEEAWRRYHLDHSEKRIQLGRIQRALDRARRFKEAIELGRETIQAVAVETHRRWADFLNQRVGELLGSIGHGIEQVRFGDDLDFSVRLRGGQQLARGKADQQLSCGARDQLYLAVRLAISEFLSRGAARLPLLLDDVFATSDDERARAGMRLLIERFSAEHQILMLTCHRGRHERLAELDRELYEQRVQWLEARSAEVPG